MLAIPICGKAEKESGIGDDSRIVLDEWAGYFLAAAGLPLSWFHLVLTFVLFRILDIWKPFPVCRLQRLPGGLGIVADDVAAGIISGLLVRLIVPYSGVLTS